MTTVNQPTTQPRPATRPGRLLVRLLVNVAAPLALYYGLRAAGTSIYLALLASTLLSVITTAVPLIRDRRVNGLAIYMTSMLLVSVGVSLLAGSPRFLLAKEAWLTGLGGVWFLASLRARRPLAYLYTRPMLENRFGWPGSWDEVWDRSPRFRRMWRVSSVLWGIGTLLDAVLRVVMAYTLPVDAVPGLATVLYAVTSVVLVAVTNIYYILARSPDWWPRRTSRTDTD